MTNDTKLVRYTPEVVHKTVGTGVSYGVAEMREREQGIYVTHADYRALEGELFEATCTMAQQDEKIASLEVELAALRVRVGELP